VSRAEETKKSCPHCLQKSKTGRRDAARKTHGVRQMKGRLGGKTMFELKRRGGERKYMTLGGKGKRACT